VQWLRKCRGDFDLGRDYIYGIFDRRETEILGGTGLHLRYGPGVREIGYWISKSHMGQGLATEVALALVKVAFLVDEVSRVEIHCDPKNEKSAAIPRRLGFVHEATLRHRRKNSTGAWGDTMIWTLLAEEFPKSPSNQVRVEAYDVLSRRLV
jgi:RimJ/RimL family protein N-acetyltransferase